MIIKDKLDSKARKKRVSSLEKRRKCLMFNKTLQILRFRKRSTGLCAYMNPYTRN